jgi:hypothetical protein
MQQVPDRPPDPFMDFVGAGRDWLRHIIKGSNWKITLAAGLGFASRLVWPWIPDDMASRGLLGLFAVSLGACVGRGIDRALARRRQRLDKARSSTT